MMPYQSYQLWQIERHKTPAEQYAADMRRGMFAAAVSRSAWRTASKVVATAAGSRQVLALRRPAKCGRPAARVPG
jgi:hypothetical protein